LPEKLLCGFCLQIFSDKDHVLYTFFGVTSGKTFICFSANVGRHFFEDKQRWTSLLPKFQEFCPDFQQIKTFGGACTPAFYTTG